ncbi:CbtA family protein [Marinobacter sp. JSM 1782161]|uniref:CbtA family protein n=1 Tax=Marinobacter sp. JSM 1782161 TaxID=2685906 RepID=UPI001403F642|nr:CbtA family protein [Marinobacter sp. JSM 1782161]
MFRSLILSACVIGVVAGLAMTAFQSFGVTPIILAAEQYEVSEPAEPESAHPHEAAGHTHEHGQAGDHHHHGGDEWAPADGFERTFYSAVSNICAGIGFAALLLVVMNQLRERGRMTPNASRGLLLGALGFVAVFMAPSLGLPPEVPGASAAALESRQLWWVATVLLTVAGLGILFLAGGWQRILGVPLLLVTHFFVPTHEGPMFSHPDPDAVTALNELHHQFIWATGLSNLAFWLLIGVLCAVTLNYLSRTGRIHHEQVPA